MIEWLQELVLIFERGWVNYVARTSGPMNFRFLLQPTVAIFLAVRAGIKDARTGHPAFLWTLLTNKEFRWPLLREALKDTSKIFIMAIVLDSIYQLAVHQAIYVLELLFTATTLAFIPYVLVRGPVKHLTMWLRTSPPGRRKKWFRNA